MDILALCRPLTDAVERDLDGAGRRPDGGVDEQTEGHHPQGQDGGAGRHADTEEGEHGRGRALTSAEEILLIDSQFYCSVCSDEN